LGIVGQFGLFAITCEDGVVEIRSVGADLPQYTMVYPASWRPFATIGVDDIVVTSFAATGQLARFDIADNPPVMLSPIEGIEDARGLARWPDGRVAVSRWRSPDDEGQIALIDVVTGEREIVSLAYDPTPPSDTEIGGVPSYLDQILVSPIADQVAVPSIQAN